MILFWSRSKRGNVGDDLNPVIWKALLGDEFFDDDHSEVLIGIGSILSKQFHHGDKTATKWVFGSGARSPWSLPDIDSYWNFMFVRGPNTARLLEKYSVEFITDPAIMTPLVVDRLNQEGGQRPKRIAFIPHHQTPKAYSDWICRELDLMLVSPSLSPREFISSLTSCEYAVCEAMHGAILADSYRIPWMGTRLFSEISEGFTSRFKWLDWLKSMDLDETSMVQVSPALARFARKGLHRYIISGLQDPRVVPVYAGYISKKLRTCILSDHWSLSDDRVLLNRQERISEVAHQLKISRQR